MRLSLPSHRLVPIVLLGVVAVALMAIVAGRVGGGGEGGGSGTDARQVVERAFSAKSFNSGRFDATAQVSLENSPVPELSSFAVKMDGAFDSTPAPPQSDLDLSFSVAGRTIEMGFVSTGKDQFVTLGDRAYRVPPGQLDRSGAKPQGQDATALAALGIDPQSWLVNPSYVGTADVGGVETDHVTAQVDTGKLLNDLSSLAARTGQDTPLTGQDSAQLQNALKGAAMDLYAAKSDGSLRKLSAQARVEAPERSGQLQLGGTGTIAFDMQFTDVGKPQEINAPEGARPIGEFESAFNGRVLQAFSSPRSGGGGSQQPGDSAASDSTAPAPAVPSPAQKYLDCVQQAGTSADIQQCAPLLD